jgi:hypothetical protein
MIDYAEPLLAIAKNYKTISKLLILEDDESTVDEINDLIINAIDLKMFIKKKKNAHKSD